MRIGSRVLMANGRIVADGPTTEIKALVSSHTIHATLPNVPRATRDESKPEATDVGRRKGTRSSPPLGSAGRWPRRCAIA